ncbi:hypothetical protein CBR_g742 [Chara braunii]|uniref:Midasin n=1 Tax=Chara braunii TaxID=69332 RepID=A0A388KC20_CHABU|nr:hypothetical protein CBR_g742 [Chara braunii]|eukprot:GBG67612.1 hypothetical protein CBR_g742 [Chara braunii]
MASSRLAPMAAAMASRNFDMKNAFMRLVGRKPELRRMPAIVQLIERTDPVEDEEHVLALAQFMLVKPGITLAAGTCFRPMLLHLVERHVQALKCGSTSLFEKYRSQERNVKGGHSSHSRNTDFENTSVALSFLLCLCPQLLGTVLRYFSFAPSPFECLVSGGVTSHSHEKDGVSLLEIARATYRYMKFKPAAFRDLWNWSPFFDLLLWHSPTHGGGHRMSPDDATDMDEGGGGPSDVRWCAARTIGLLFHIGDSGLRKLFCSSGDLSQGEELQCAMRWESIEKEIAVERAAMFLYPFQSLQAEDSSTTQSIVGCEGVISAGLARHGKRKCIGKGAFVNICGIDLPAKDAGASQASPEALKGRTLVLTKTTVKNLEALVLGLCQRRPILLEGPPGVGKSVLIDEVARITGNHDIIKVHLDDQMDSKTLLGSYVCTEVPGEFKWQAGALTQAVSKGIWIVFENIDMAPFEILSALIPLLEDRKLYIPGRGEVIEAAHNFQILASVTRSGHGTMSESGARSKEILDNLWMKVTIDEVPGEELAAVLQALFRIPRPVVLKMIGTFDMMRKVSGKSAVLALGSTEAAFHISRQFSTRDLVKWCQRAADLAEGAFSGPSLPPHVREHFFLECVNCFVDMIPKINERACFMKAIAEEWGVAADRVDYYLNMHKPAVQAVANSLHVGRGHIQARDSKRRVKSAAQLVSSARFARTGHVMRLMEKIVRCIEHSEPVLLVGETGTGKTAVVQYLARQLDMPLTVLNMSQQSDSADFLGGFKPVETRAICLPLFDVFSRIFRSTFPTQQNREFLSRVQKLAEKRKWAQLLQAFRMAVGRVSKLFGRPLTLEFDEDESVERSPKRKRPLDDKVLEEWRAFAADLAKAERQVEAAQSAFAFAFVEGALVKALRLGHWLLLDEVNLAPAETLERLSGVLEATDVGKRDLPAPLKNRFTELYVDELTNREDLRTVVLQYLEGQVPKPPVDDVVNFYLTARQEAEGRLLDSANQRPEYSLRTLCRALEYVCAALPVYGFQRALYDGFCMSFLTLLERQSAPVMERLIFQFLLRSPTKPSDSVMKSLLRPPQQPSPNHILFEQFWVEGGAAEPSAQSLESANRYVLTKSVREHLKNLARAVLVRKYPILLQGPTSSGKTSLVEYLATKTGHRFVRINNHEHTDIQEYLGSYVTDSSGKLVFQEGVLVEAVRKGYWIVLDELNLAPSDVLEALNRLLDDNRELFVPELQMTIKPHPHFMLFATQNPPGIYGGRKVLSRAFRNRFMELHIDDIPDEELVVILEKRCLIPPSYAAKMVEVMKDLQRHRQSSQVFAGKHGFITPRDLFRWAERHANGYRPVRDRERIRLRFVAAVSEVQGKHLPSLSEVELNSEIQEGASVVAAIQTVISDMRAKQERREGPWAEKARKKVTGSQTLKAAEEELEALEAVAAELQSLHAEWQALFTWHDGPLVRAMRNGDMILIDEISLAEDSVLERLNSLLEPKRLLVLAERGGQVVEEIVAHPNFRLMATMNPGGDFGKKELSPALRNRFTEVWVPAIADVEDLRSIVIDRFGSENLYILAEPLLDFWQWFHHLQGGGKALSVRDILAWVTYINVAALTIGRAAAYVHGACLVLLDGIGLGMGVSEEVAQQLRKECYVYLLRRLPEEIRNEMDPSCVPSTETGLFSSSGVTNDDAMEVQHDDALEASCSTVTGVGKCPEGMFGIAPFYIGRGAHSTQGARFELGAPTTSRNALRVLRAMQLRKPVLLEGSPGVGKTSLISAIATASGHRLVRINLSEQTDMMDLLGSDLPSEGGQGGQFQWSDGVFLQALKAGDWVLLDELNLASQSILEGLNACLDHRAEVFIPELNQTFK